MKLAPAFIVSLLSFFLVACESPDEQANKEILRIKSEYEGISANASVLNQRKDLLSIKEKLLSIQKKWPSTNVAVSIAGGVSVAGLSIRDIDRRIGRILIDECSKDPNALCAFGSLKAMIAAEGRGGSANSDGRMSGFCA